MKTMTLSALKLQRIIYWMLPEETPGHCLARVYQNPEERSKAKILLSEIRSNSEETALMLNLVRAANALVPELLRYQIEPQGSLWIIHHGPFSRYEFQTHEEFAQVEFIWQENSCECVDWPRWQMLTSAQAGDLQQSLQIAPVFEVLNSLQSHQSECW